MLGLVMLSTAAETRSDPVKIARSVLADKIEGGWAGQTIGCTYGGPTEFRFQSTFIPSYQPIARSDDAPSWWYKNAPGLYDDVYMDLTFVEVLEKEGLEAPAASFAKAFANAVYPLWHANQAARYNILHGIMPPDSGRWLNNPHADDIDFQIEADFAGLMSPGLPGAAARICDRVGHIMNSGDGWYGGVYMATMLSLAFIRDDVHKIVTEALAAIPAQSAFAATIRDVVRLHDEDPRDWKKAWFEVERTWGEDVGCPEGVFTPFNIDAKINAAWVAIGLLYGDDDFGKTLEIAARCGDDSDCNPASAGGILGTMLGYSRIPVGWTRGLAMVEDKEFAYTTISLRDASELSFKHALKVVAANGGEADGTDIVIPTQPVAPVRFERNFEGHFPAERRRLETVLRDEYSFDFGGIGFALVGGIVRKGKVGSADESISVRMEIDDRTGETVDLPASDLHRRETPFWKYALPAGPHHVRLKVLKRPPGLEVSLGDLVVYRDKPPGPKADLSS